MEKRSTPLERRTYQAHEIVVPKSVEEAFLKREPGAPMYEMVAQLKEANVQEEDIESYVEAVKRFFNRPSEIIYQSDEKNVTLRPDFKMFRPLVTFPDASYLPAPDFLKAIGAKPELKRAETAHMSKSKLTPELALQAFEKSPKNEEQNAQMARWLVLLNRLMYFMHEPVHIIEHSAIKDRWDWYTRQLGIQDLVDVSRADEILNGKIGKYGEPNMPEGMGEDVGRPLVDSLMVARKDTNYPIYTQEFYTEMTIDVLVDRAIRPFLLKQPALLLWLHNTMTCSTEALTELIQRFKRAIHDPSYDAAQHAQDVASYTRIKNVLQFTKRAYFAAFDSSDDAQAYFAAHERRAVLGSKQLSGICLEGARITAFDVINMVDDANVLVSGRRRPRETVFSSGEAHYGMHPVTAIGVENAKKIFKAAIKQDMSHTQLAKIVDEFGAPLRRMQKGVIAPVEGIEGMTFTGEEREDSHGAISVLLNPDNSQQYESYFFMQKQIVEMVLQEDPEIWHRMVRFTVREHQEFTFTADRFFTLMGIAYFDSSGDLKYREWEGAGANSSALAHDKELGVLKLDMTLLNEDQIATFKSFLESIRTYKTLSEEQRDVQTERTIRFHCEEMFAKMAAWRRSQVS